MSQAGAMTFRHASWAGTPIKRIGCDERTFGGKLDALPARLARLGRPTEATA